MAEFTKVPYIEQVLSEVSGEDKAKLLRFVNGLAANSNSALEYLPKTLTELNALSAGIYPVDIAYVPSIRWKGYFIKTNHYSVLITFRNGIDLNEAGVYNVDSRGYYDAGEISANYLRDLLREDAYIDVSELPGAPDMSKVQAVIETSNITGLSDSQLNDLKVGDVVRKITGLEKHCYTVTYKQEQHGICLSYFDAGYLETVSYDKVGGHWVYNSTDVTPLAGSEIFEVSGSMSEPETTIEITQAQYQKLLGNDVVLKVNNTEDGSSVYMYKTNDVTEPNMAIYSNILTNASFNAIVEPVRDGEEQVIGYEIAITGQELGGGTKLYLHTITGLKSGNNIDATLYIYSLSRTIPSNYSALKTLVDERITGYAYFSATRYSLANLTPNPATFSCRIFKIIDVSASEANKFSGDIISGSSFTDVVTEL